MEGFDAVGAERAEVAGLQDVQHLGEDDPSGGGRAHAVDVEASIEGVDRLPDVGLVGVEVLQGDEAAAALMYSTMSSAVLPV